MAEKVSPCDEHIPNLLSPFLLFCYQVATGFVLSRSLSLDLGQWQAAKSFAKHPNKLKIYELTCHSTSPYKMNQVRSVKRARSPEKMKSRRRWRRRREKCVSSIKFAFVVERPFPTQSRKLLWAPMYVSCLDDCISLAYLAPLYPYPSSLHLHWHRLLVRVNPSNLNIKL